MLILLQKYTCKKTTPLSLFFKISSLFTTFNKEEEGKKRAYGGIGKKVNEVKFKIIKTLDGRQNILIRTSLNIYFIINVEFINLALLQQSILTKVDKSFKENRYKQVYFKPFLSYKHNIKLRSKTTKIQKFIDSLNYPGIVKFKIIGKFFKIKKKNNLIICSLIFAHKYFFYLNIAHLSTKLKKIRTIERRRLIFFTPFTSNLFFNKAERFSKLRASSIYTTRGIKSFTLIKNKRIGKKPHR